MASSAGIRPCVTGAWIVHRVAEGGRSVASRRGRVPAKVAMLRMAFNTVCKAAERMLEAPAAGQQAISSARLRWSAAPRAASGLASSRGDPRHPNAAPGSHHKSATSPRRRRTAGPGRERPRPVDSSSRPPRAHRPRRQRRPPATRCRHNLCRFQVHAHRAQCPRRQRRPPATRCRRYDLCRFKFTPTARRPRPPSAPFPLPAPRSLPPHVCAHGRPFAPTPAAPASRCPRRDLCRFKFARPSRAHRPRPPSAPTSLCPTARAMTPTPAAPASRCPRRDLCRFKFARPLRAHRPRPNGTHLALPTPRSLSIQICAHCSCIDLDPSGAHRLSPRHDRRSLRCQEPGDRGICRCGRGRGRSLGVGAS